MDRAPPAQAFVSLCPLWVARIDLSVHGLTLERRTGCTAMSDIYYNPVRRSAPRSLFQPIQEDEARFYVESHHNPLRLRPPPFPVLFTHPPLARPPSPPKRTPPPSPIGYAPPSPILMRAPGNGAVDAGLSLRSPKVAEPNVEAVAEVTRKRKLEDLGPPEEDQNGFRPSPVDRVREERNTVVVDHCSSPSFLLCCYWS